MPINTDAVCCSPLTTIRESQSAGTPAPTFGNQGLAIHSNSAQQSPGPPFHVARAPVNLDVDPSAPYFTSRRDLPDRHKERTGLPLLSSAAPITVMGSVSPPSDLGLSPSGTGANGSPATSNSQRGPSSHTSFTPPGDSGRTQRYPPNMCAPNNTNPIGSVAEAAYFHPTDEQLTNFNTAQLFPSPVGFGMHPWDLSGEEHTSTGMTSVSDAPLAWGQMLESMNGWEGVGQEHGF